MNNSNAIGLLAWRYLRSRRSDNFVSFIALMSLLGMILGVAALIVVMSVMNGFESELRQRVLALVPHGYIQGDQPLTNWPLLREKIEASNGIIGAAPAVGGKVLVSVGKQVRGVQLHAIDPELEPRVSRVMEKLVSGDASEFATTPYGIYLGQLLARQLGVQVGDSVTIMLPKVTVTPMGLFPRQRRFVVAGTFSAGAQLDATTAYIRLQDGQKLYQLGDAVQGLRVAVNDLFQARAILSAVTAALPGDLQFTDWSESQGSLFQAVKMEKQMIRLLLMAIVLVAAFNIISILAMTVKDKEGDIAVLRTLGMPDKHVLWLFTMQGLTIGAGGIFLGIIIGLPLAIYAGDIVAAIERMTGSYLFDPNVYFISHLPSVVMWSDVVVVAIVGLLLSWLATIYPAWRAAGIEPAAVLRYE
jgi:lipoprotein-releasing system permease protein